MIDVGVIIKVKNKNGSFVEGEVLELCDFGMPDRVWWVKYGTQTSLFEEESLIKWNTERKCVCGALTTDQPGHSYWCEYDDDKSDN